MYTHTNCQWTSECSGMWQSRTALFKVYVCQDPLPQTPTGGARERWGLLSIASELIPPQWCDQGCATWGRQFRVTNRPLNVFFCLPLFLLLVAVRLRRCVPCEWVGLIQLFSNPISPKRLFDAICERVALVKTEREEESGDQSFADTLLYCLSGWSLSTAALPKNCCWKTASSRRTPPTGC